MRKKFVAWYYAETKKSDFLLILATGTHLFFLIFFDYFLKENHAFLYSTLILACSVFAVFGLKTMFSILVDDHKKFTEKQEKD